MPGEFSVGDRIHSDGHFGTVRYIGPVAGTKGEYYGIEWDVMERGKHNGSHNGQSYFTTRNNEKSGSFVKAKLLTPSVTATEAVTDKYGHIDDESAGVDEDEAFLYQPDSDRVIKVEVVGMRSINDLQCKFDELENVNLSCMMVHGEPDSAGFGAMLTSVRELDLSRNLLNSWDKVAEITQHLSQLQSLTLWGNRLGFEKERTATLRSAFTQLRKINLAKMNLNWNQIVDYSEMWPGVSELHVPMNNISEIKTLPNLHNLCVLNLDGNQLSTWQNLTVFGQLKSLREMLLNHCSLRDITIEEGEFPRLAKLSLTHNEIDDWRHIAELNKVAHLRDLFITHNPLLERSDKETNRQFIIVKLPQLEIHNRTQIDGPERRGAEIDYHRTFGKDWLEAGDSIEFKQLHPTYSSLIKKWGEILREDVFKEAMTELEKSLVTVNLVNQVTGKTVKKKIPLTMQVQKVRNLACKLLRCDAFSEVRYRAKENGVIYQMDNELRDLSWYAVSEGDDILIGPNQPCGV